MTNDLLEKINNNIILYWCSDIHAKSVLFVKICLTNINLFLNHYIDSVEHN